MPCVFPVLSIKALSCSGPKPNFAVAGAGRACLQRPACCSFRAARRLLSWLRPVAGYRLGFQYQSPVY
jgi:hypothetical protein